MLPPAIDHTRSARRGCWILVAPIVMVSLIVGAYLTVGVLGFFGHKATGERVVLTYQSCPEADTILLARATEMGLGSPVIGHIGDRTTLTVTLPDNASAAASIPTTLGDKGVLLIHGPDQSIMLDNAAITDVSVSVGMLGESLVVLGLTPGAAKSLRKDLDDAQGAIALLDGQPFSQVAPKDLNKSKQLKMIPTADDPKTQITMAARAHILLNSGIMPCDVALIGQQTAQ